LRPGVATFNGAISIDLLRGFREVLCAAGGSLICYLYEAYSYLPGDLSGGWGMITNPRTFGKHPGIEPEKAVDYFRRTRPNQGSPTCIEDKNEEGSYIDFIIRLRPLKEESMPPDMEEDGCIKWQYRKPAICPTGIRSDIVEE
jgi:hypothetical protein